MSSEQCFYDWSWHLLRSISLRRFGHMSQARDCGGDLWLWVWRIGSAGNSKVGIETWR